MKELAQIAVNLILWTVLAVMIMLTLPFIATV
jgi:hypothetical protein